MNARRFDLTNRKPDPMKNDAGQVVGISLRQVVPERTPEEMASLKIPLFAVPSAVVVAVARRSRRPLVTRAELDELRNSQEEFDRVEKFMNDHGPDQARKAFRKQAEQFENASRSDSGCEAARQSDFWSMNDFEEDFFLKRKTAKDRLRAISYQLSAIAERVGRRLARLAHEEAEAIEVKEREFFAAFSFDYSPSPVLRTLRCMSCRSDYYTPGICSPRRLLAFAGIEDSTSESVDAAD